MSVSTSTSSVSYVGNNSTSTAYVVPYVFFDSTDLKVYSVDAAGVSTLLTITTQYRVSGGAGSTGSVTTTSAIPATSTVIITRSVPYTQLTSFTTGDRLPAASIEKALDKLTMESQQLSRNTMPDTALTAGSAPYVLGLSASGGSPSWVPQSSSGITDGSITTSKLSDSSVTTAKIADNSITSAKIADNSITSAKIADGAIATTDLANGSVIPAKLSTGGPSWDTSGNVSANSYASYRYDSSSNGGQVQFARASDNTIAHTIQEFGSGTTSRLRVVDSIAGVERMTIDTSGNVGIGTSSPTARLDVTAETSKLQIDPNFSASGAAYIQSSGTTSGLLVGTFDAKPVSLITSNTLRLTVDAGGSISTQNNPITNCPTTAKAWVVFDGNTSPYSITANYNVSSVTRVASSNFYVNFTTAFANTNYAVLVSMSSSTTSGVANGIPYLGARGTTQAQVFAQVATTANAPASAPDQIVVAVFAR